MSAWCFPISQYTVFVDRFKRNITDKKFVLDKLADTVENILRKAKPVDQEVLIFLLSLEQLAMLVRETQHKFYSIKTR